MGCSFRACCRLKSVTAVPEKIRGNLPVGFLRGHVPVVPCR
ncbi:hypothetical protein NEIPOLOT_01697 [Neisseria polysaccharea ATCC 43768]|nr:hypothetical protein NEIPOLOT_01697 [Neisseria polysaccharea ATCC 43768]